MKKEMRVLSKDEYEEASLSYWDRRIRMNVLE